MSRIAVIAVREFKQTVFRKVFVLAVIGIPILIVLGMGLAIVVMVGHEEPPLVGTIAVVDTTGDVAEAATVEFRPEEIAADRRKDLQAAQEAGEEALRAGGMPTPLTTPGATRFKMGMGKGDVDVTIEAHTASDADIDSLRRRVRDGDLLAAGVFSDVLADQLSSHSCPAHYEQSHDIHGRGRREKPARRGGLGDRQLNVPLGRQPG